MMNVRTALAVLGLAIASSAALAFDEQKSAPGATDPGRASAMETIKTPDGGTLKLPGIGQIPKLDFGLELLYRNNPPQVPVPQKQDDNDLQIRATIKYRTN